MKLLIYGGSCMSQNFSFIAPMRIARICKKYGHDVRVIEWANPQVPEDRINFINREVEERIKVSSLHVDSMLSHFKTMLDSWKPDVIFSMGYTHAWELREITTKLSIPFGILVGDPFFASYPASSLSSLMEDSDFIAFNEGQALNWTVNNLPSTRNKCFLLNHAIDKALCPSYEEVAKQDKKYICSIVGGDDRIRRRELLNYFYQWTTKFPNCRFATGGSHTKGANEPYLRKDLDPNYLENSAIKWNVTEFTLEEVDKYENKVFNLDFIHNDLPFPLGLSHESVHKLYSESVYGFTPYGKYLVDGRVSEYTGMTFGTKIFEMGGSGAAMVSNRIKDIEKVIIHGETGWIFDKPEDAYEAFKFAVNNPKDAKQMGLNAYKFIHENHSWDNRYEDVLLPIFKSVGVM